MATTTNYSWSTPDDTALVKDGAAAIRSLGTAIDTTVFTNAGAAIPKTIVDAKGDIVAATAADTVARLAVGANNTVLTADSTTATGLKWAAAAGGGKVLQVIQAETSTLITVASTSFTDAGLTASITPTASTSKILVIYNQNVFASRATTGVACSIQLLRGATSIQNLGFPLQINIAGSTNTGLTGNYGAVYLDSPATTSATTYKTQIALNTTANSGVAEANNNNISSIVLLEIGA